MILCDSWWAWLAGLWPWRMYQAVTPVTRRQRPGGSGGCRRHSPAGCEPAVWVERRARSGHPLPGCGGSAWVGVGGLEVAQGELAYLPAERLPGVVVQEGVLASEDAAEPGLVGGRLQAGEAAGDAGQIVRGHRDGLVRSEERGQDGGGGFADRAVRARVGRIRGRDRQRGPVRRVGVELDGGVVAGVAQTDGRHRSPHL